MSQGTNQTAQQRKTAENAGKHHKWPDEAGDCDLNSWDIYVKNQDFRAHQDWLAGDLIELARVSKLQAVSIYEMDKYVEEGAIIMGGKTGSQPVENPRGRAIATLNGTITAMLRRLGITTMAVAEKQSRSRRARDELEAEDAENESKRKGKKNQKVEPGDFLN